jgi:hypothetical protein
MSWFRRLLRNGLFWLLPAVAIWLLITPIYNRFLVEATQNLMRLSELPNRTTLSMHDRHHVLIYRNDVRAQTSTGHVSSLRVTDYHFPLIFTAVLFLAVPGVALKRRLGALGWAFLLSATFHLVALSFRVKFVYATQLGAWSLENYGAFARNFWGLTSHLLNLPFAFGLPLLLWCGFFWAQLAGALQPPELEAPSPQAPGGGRRD